MTNKFPSEFFNIPHPTTPSAAIQFRTKVNSSKDIDDPSLWEEVTFDPNNFFNTLTLEDSGGVVNLNLTLEDRDYVSLERVIVNMLLAQKESNSLTGEKKVARDAEEYFQFFIDKKKTANIRIRIGYSETDEDYISSASFEDNDYLNRINNNKPVIRSPWLYFIITDIDLNLTESGLQIIIQGIESTGTFLEKATMVQRFAKLQGTPKDILENIKKTLVEASKLSSSNGSTTIDFEFIDEPLMYTGKDGSQDIEVLLGGKPRLEIGEDGKEKEILRYKKIKTLLNEICSKVSPIMYDSNGTPVAIDITDNTEDDEEGEIESEDASASEYYSYSYFVSKKNGKDIITFYYRNPRKQAKEQSSIRTYTWMESGHSIIEDLSLKIISLFGQLNMAVILKDNEGNNAAFVPRPNEDNSTGTGNLTDLSGVVSGDTASEATLASNVLGTSQYSNNSGTIGNGLASLAMMRDINAKVSNMLARGSITLPGDPFFFFDAKILPFTYMINILVGKPSYIDENGEYQQSEQSYLSGKYGIGKITHSLSAGSYSTVLEIQKMTF